MTEDDDLMNEGDDETSQATGRAKGEKDTVDKPALLERIATSSGLPKPQVRKILDAALTEIGATLDSGGSLALPPLGKLRLVRQSEQGGNQVLTLKLRRSTAKPVENAGGDKNAAHQSAGAQARARMKAGAVARKAVASGQPHKAPDKSTAPSSAEHQKKSSGPLEAKPGKAQAKTSASSRKEARTPAKDSAADDG